MHSASRRPAPGPALLRALLTSSALALGACSSSSGTSPPAEPSAVDLTTFGRLSYIIPAQLTTGGASEWTIVDTGNPWVVLDPAGYPDASNLGNGGNLSLDVNGQTQSGIFTLSSNTADVRQTGTSFALYGNIGCTFLCNGVAAFNYRDVVFTYNPTTTPDGLGASVMIPFALSGGGTIDGIALPKSRIVVPVTLEGTTYMMIVDTGASYVTVSQRVFSALTADGRAQVGNIAAMTTSGSSSASITRARTVILGSVEQDDIVVSHDTSFDMNLANLTTDVGMTIDGSLGGTFLHDYYLTVDYAHEQLSLAPYTDTSMLPDPAELIGITLATSGSGFVVGAVTSLAARQGVSVGDSVTAIDGQTLSGLDTFQVSALLFGPLGTSRTVSFGQARTLGGQSVPIAVENYLPLPAKK